ncbi:MAG: DUF1684 domain-containing protein [Gemmatimonadetes bacterium]|nr:DUF1684 domain-containing protein [Gemmatimonadota bacterium]
MSSRPQSCWRPSPIRRQCGRRRSRGRRARCRNRHARSGVRVVCCCSLLASCRPAPWPDPPAVTLEQFTAVAFPDQDGWTLIDFNRAYNPPCAFTPYSTCALRPEERRLALSIPVGEKRAH